MDSFVKEYIRVMNSVSFGESEKEVLLNNITKTLELRKSESRKQFMVASAALVAITACVSIFMKSGNKTR